MPTESYVVNADYDGPAEFALYDRARDAANRLNRQYGAYYRFAPQFIGGRFLIVQRSRKLESIATSTLHEGTGRESCQRLAESDCAGGNTRYYGEMLPDNAFTGWRGPFCSAHCYRISHPSEPLPFAQA